MRTRRSPADGQPTAACALARALQRLARSLPSSPGLPAPLSPDGWRTFGELALAADDEARRVAFEFFTKAADDVAALLSVIPRRPLPSTAMVRLRHVHAEMLEVRRLGEAPPSAELIGRLFDLGRLAADLRVRLMAWDEAISAHSARPRRARLPACLAARGHTGARRVCHRGTTRQRRARRSCSRSSERGGSDPPPPDEPPASSRSRGS